MTSMAEHLQQARQNLAPPQPEAEPFDIADTVKRLRGFGENMRDILEPLLDEINAARAMEKPGSGALRLCSRRHDIKEKGQPIGTFHDYWIEVAGLMGSFMPRLLTDAHDNRVYFSAARPSIASSWRYQFLSTASLAPEDRENFKAKLAEALVRLKI